MPTKITVALSKESGPPECGSLEVTCTLAFDENSTTLQDGEIIQRAVRSAVMACHQTLQEAVARQP